MSKPRFEFCPPSSIRRLTAEVEGGGFKLFNDDDGMGFILEDGGDNVVCIDTLESSRFIRDAMNAIIAAKALPESAPGGDE